MNRLLDCLVMYFGLDEEERPAARRYFCYHLIAGPGPAAGAGLASILTVGISDEDERVAFKALHTVATGGPEAALAAAIHHLDVHHGNDRLRRIQSEIRGVDTSAGANGTRHLPCPLPCVNGSENHSLTGS